MRRALAVDEAGFGKDHPNVAVGLNNLAALLKATIRLGEAEPLLHRALAIFLAFRPPPPAPGRGDPQLPKLCWRRWATTRPASPTHPRPVPRRGPCLTAKDFHRASMPLASWLRVFVVKKPNGTEGAIKDPIPPSLPPFTPP
jgi:Tetratricopeptide repeat